MFDNEVLISVSSSYIQLLTKSITPNSNMIKMNNETPTIGKKESGDNLSGNIKIKTNESCIIENGKGQSEATAVMMPTTPEKMSIDAISNANCQPHSSKTQDLGVSFLSDYYNIPFEVLKEITITNPLSLLNEKYLESISPTMVRVSPISEDFDKFPLGNLNYYNSERFNKELDSKNLVNCMKEISKIWPSWSLSIVRDPSKYIIYHMKINMYGIPEADKCIVLDMKFNGFVTINMCLKHKYNKQYKTTIELARLINELNDL